MNELIAKSVKRYRSWHRVQTPALVERIWVPLFALACLVTVLNQLIGPDGITYLLDLCFLGALIVCWGWILVYNWRSKRLWLILSIVIIAAFITSLLIKLIYG